MTVRLSSAELDAALAVHAEAERGLQVAACLDGELVVDAATSDAAQSAAYPVFSVGKGIVALAVHLQALRGLLELDAPIARYWPEYAAGGKHAITIRHVLSHRAGVPQAPDGLTPELLGDRTWLLEQIVAATPICEPGTVNAYHPLTFGWILAEVVRRTDPAARALDVFVAEELCEPLGADGFWFGIPADIEARVARLTYPQPPPSPPADAPVTVANPPAVALGPDVFNRPDVHRMTIPAVGAISDARSLARLFATYGGGGTVDGRRYLGEDSLHACLTPRPGFEEPDATYGRRLPLGTGGLWIEGPGVISSGERVLAHPGVGGSVAWAELDAGLSVAICHDQMFASTAEHPDHPFSAVADAVRAIAAAHT